MSVIAGKRDIPKARRVAGNYGHAPQEWKLWDWIMLKEIPMRSPGALMVMFSVLAGLAGGCQEKTKEPVAEAPAVHEEPLARFPESLVPKPETQPQALAASPSAKPAGGPVDTGATAAPPARAGAAKPKPQPKEHYAAAPAKDARTYVVQKGDTLQKISQKFYGTTKKWRRIYRANQDALPKGPDELPAGTKLTIP